MKCVIQRVRRASVDVDGARVSEIGTGLLVLGGVEKGDTDDTMAAAAKKIRELRIFADEEGKMNLDVAAAGGAILAVSQFTLAGSIAKGRRPSFDSAETPDVAREKIRALRDTPRRDRDPREDGRLPGDDGRQSGERRPGHVCLRGVEIQC